MQLGVFFASLGAMLFYGLSALGWGFLARLCVGADEDSGWAFTATLGLAVWIFIGGLLNDFRLVSVPALDILSGVGVLASVPYLIGGLRNRGRFAGQNTPVRLSGVLSRRPQSLPCAVLLVVVVFLLGSVMPTSVFNPHDDLQTYLARPVRMLQTGTLGGNAFDILGIDSLGAQAFLHAAVLAHFDIAFVNGADAIFCFALSGFLLIELARRLDVGWGTSSLALIAFTAIHPQIVNTSAVYSGTLMILGVLCSSTRLLEQSRIGPLRMTLRQAVPPALLTAALLALKSTFVVFAAAFWALSFAAPALAGSPRKRLLIAAGVLALGITALLAPWVALHVPNYFAALGPGSAVAGSVVVGPVGGDLSALFSNMELVWGGTVLDYGVIAVILAAAWVIAIRMLYGTADTASRATGVAVASLAGASVITYLLNGVFFEVDTAIRYGTPVLIAALPATAILLARARRGPPTTVRSASPVMIATALAAVVILFSAPLLQRITMAARGHTLVAFPLSELFFSFMADALGAPGRHRTIDNQTATAPQTTILAWTSTPFHLDFRRNRILVVSEPGLVNPWVHLPVDAGPEALRDYLLAYDVRYVLLEYASPGIKSDQEFLAYLISPYPQYRKIAQANLYLRRGLLALADQSPIIRQTPGMVLYDLAEPGTERRP